MKWEPAPFQLAGVRFLVERACAGLFWDPGLRKTSVTLAACDTFLRTKVARGVLVICPLRVAYGVWPREIEKWDEFKHLKCGVMHGTDKDKVFDSELDFYVINPEGIEWLFDRLSPLRPDEWPFDVLVVDESSKWRNMRGIRYKLLKPLLKFFRRRIILTGSPAPKNLLDVFGQVFIMDMGATLGPYFSNYRREFFHETGYGGYTWLPNEGAEAKIHKMLSPRILRFDEKDYLKLPKLTPRDVYVDLPPKARKIYNEMEDDLRTMVESGKITAVNSGVANGKCRQIAGGAVYRTDDQTGEREWILIHDAKIEALVDRVEEYEGQGCMIVYEFQHELERISDALPKAVVGSGASPKEALRIEDAWNRGEIDQLLVQPQSMGHGLNLQAGGRAQIWYTPTYDYELWDQTIRRMYRSGRTKPMFVDRLVARNTVDEVACAMVAKKGKKQGDFLDALRDYWRKRRV